MADHGWRAARPPMSNRPVIQRSSEPPGPTAGGGLAPADRLAGDADRRKRIDDYIDYFGDAALHTTARADRSRASSRKDRPTAPI
jgi:hypothetical protein